MKHTIDLKQSIVKERLKRRVSAIGLVPQIFLLVVWILALPTISGAMYFNAFHNNWIIEIVFACSIILSCLLLYGIVETRKLYKIKGLAIDKNKLLTNEIAERFNWKKDYSEDLFTVFIPEKHWYATFYSKEITIIYTGDNVLINATTFLKFDIKSPFHWLGNYKAVKAFQIEFEKAIKQ